MRIYSESKNGVTLEVFDFGDAGFSVRETGHARLPQVLRFTRRSITMDEVRAGLACGRLSARGMKVGAREIRKAKRLDRCGAAIA